MKRTVASLLCALALLPLARWGVAAQRSPREEATPETLLLTPGSMHFRTVVNGRSELTTHRGKPAIHLVPAAATAGQDLAVLAILDTPEFHEGVLELELSGTPRPDAPPDSRGFVGLAFRTGELGEWSEVFYLRPTNARSDDQVRRNRSVQYVSAPDHPWHRLRQESPGKYESYVDLVPDEWTSVKIRVEGDSARLFVNGASQPCLVVLDLKHGDVAGRIGLWAHVETDAYFGPLKVTPAAR